MFHSTNNRFMRLLAFITIFSSIVFSQTGTISGKIVGKTGNEILTGANVIVEGTRFGATADLDGNYTIKNLPIGKYNLKFTYISYNQLSVEGVEVKAGETIKIDVALESSAQTMLEVVVTAEALQNSDASLVKNQKNSLDIIDGISGDMISKTNSSDGTDVLKKMTGVTISDGKFAYIRGVGDRYNNTLLNGANLPSTEPEKKSFSYDIFPANLIESIITSKTFSPDKPADFSGGLVQIKTIEFPEKFFVNFGMSSSYNTFGTGKDALTYSGGRRWLANDDGTRALPSIVPSGKLLTNDPAFLQEVGRSFSNKWATEKTSMPVNSSLNLSFGDKYNLFEDHILGYIASITYSNSNESQEIERNNYTFDGPRYEYSGNNYRNSVMMGGLLNFSYRIGLNNKISLKNLFNQNADDEVTHYSGPYYSNPDFRDQTSLRYVTRNLFSTQLIGEHFIELLNGLKIEWNANFAQSERDEPDARRYLYSKPLDEEQPLRFQLDQSLTTRYFGKLLDKNKGVSLDLTFTPFEDPSLPSIKTGFAIDLKDRNFDARSFGFKNKPGGNFAKKDSILMGSVEEIFAPENFGPNFIEITEITKPSDSYVSSQNVTGTYLAFDFTLLNNIKVNTGVRYEYSKQDLSSKSLTNADVNISPEYHDVLPSITVTWQPTNNMNVRAAFSKTLARPEFRELAPFSYYDFIQNEIVQGNVDLKRSLINNFDFRYEFYPQRASDLIAVSFFFKQFNDPIEQVFLPSSSFEPIRSFKNAKTANNYGIELEIRKSLDFISPVLNEFAFSGNASFIKSDIEFDQAASSNGSTYQESTRPMQGQAEYVFNSGLYYDGYENGISASLVYNKVGQKIDKVGFGGLGDVIEMPRDQVDFSISKKLFNSLTLKFVVKDILAQDYLYVQRAPGGDKTALRIKKGSDVSLGVSYKF